MNIIANLCERMTRLNASDLFLSVGRIPAMRVARQLQNIPDAPPLSLEDAREFIRTTFPPGTLEALETARDLDLGQTLPHIGRFRFNLSFQRGNISLAVRRIPSGAIDAAKYGIPDHVIAMADAPRGLILVTGATCSGKSTTLAAMLHHINQTARKHIVTIEDPIEFAYDDIRSVISQREIGTDTLDFPTALKHVVRQNPDAIFIGELRDRQTLETAISAALTGHLVAATMHTMDVIQTLERIYSFFPEYMQQQVASDLSQTLVGIVSQRLLPSSDGSAAVPAFEILHVTALARRLIASREAGAVQDVIKAGGNDGMITFDRAIYDLLRANRVTLDTALAAATNREELLLMLQGMETGTDTFRSYSADPEQGISIGKLLNDAVSYGASDLILTVDAPPTIRLDGQLRTFDMPRLTATDTKKLLFSVLTHTQRADFEQNREIDFALSIKGSDSRKALANTRFRVNGFYQRGAAAATFRVIPSAIPTPAEIGLPAVMLQLCNRRQGLVLITGPTGSGKSTTLACMLNVINQTRSCHVITVEDPIEFVHTHNQCLIEQREVHDDTLSFDNALKYVLRQDPDIILIGEMRDPETIATALTAAETGHLVFATLHTNDVTQSVDRIVDVFPAERQSQIRIQLAASLEAVVAQRLFKRADAPTGRIAAFEILLGTTAVKALIRDKKTHQLQGVMEGSAKDGMVTMERALMTLLQQGKITREDYASAVPNKYTAVAGQDI